MNTHQVWAELIVSLSSLYIGRFYVSETLPLAFRAIVIWQAMRIGRSEEGKLLN